MKPTTEPLPRRIVQQEQPEDFFRGMLSAVAFGLVAWAIIIFLYLHIGDALERGSEPFVAARDMIAGMVRGK